MCDGVLRLREGPLASSSVGGLAENPYGTGLVVIVLT